MNESASISQWIVGLKAGESDAVQQIWQRYSERLVEVARQRLGGAPKRVADEEDVAQSVFFSLCRGADAGRLADIKGRDELWWLLLSITRMKVADHVRRETAQKRGGNHRVHGESEMLPNSNRSHGFSLDDLIGQEPTPETMASLAEQHDRLLVMLRDDTLRGIAIARLEGYTTAEIARDHAISTRSVERKLQLIRNRWAEELSNAH